jgi:hypothetical protein
MTRKLLNLDELVKILKPFKAVFLEPNFTLIKYEMLHPDRFCYLFHGKDTAGRNVYWVLLQTDYIASLAKAKEIIEDWHGSKVLDVERPDSANDSSSAKDIDKYLVQDGAYSSLLARVEKPTGDGYWAKVFIILPGDSISAKIAHLNKKDQESVRKALAVHLSHKSVDANKSFLEAFQERKEFEDKTKDTDINHSNYGFLGIC